jgi:hypothetical protein
MRSKIEGKSKNLPQSAFRLIKLCKQHIDPNDTKICKASSLKAFLQRMFNIDVSDHEWREVVSCHVSTGWKQTSLSDEQKILQAIQVLRVERLSVTKRLNVLNDLQKYYLKVIWC